MGGYTSSLEHVVAELERLDLLLSVQVRRAQLAHPDEGDALGSLFVTDAEVDRLLATPIGAPPWAAVPLPAEVMEPVQARLDEMADTLARRTEESVREGVHLRLLLLAHLFGLAPFDLDVVLVCLAPEMDRRYERLFGYLQDDVTRRQPSVDLVLHLLCPDLGARVAARSRFSSSAPLIRHQLVRLADDPGPGAGSGPPTLLAKAIRLDPRVARFLLDDDGLDDRLLPLARLVDPTADRGEGPALVFPAPFADDVARLLGQAATDGGRLLVYCQGPYGVGRESVAAASAAMLGADLLVVDGRRLADASAAECAELARLVDREARLQGAVLLVERFDALLAPDRQAHLAPLLPLLDDHPGPTFLAGETPWEPRDALQGTTFVRLELPPPGPEERRALWESALAAGSPDRDAGGDDSPDDPGTGLDPDVDLATLANTFRLTGGQIVDAAATARNRARARGADRVTQDDLNAGCRLQSNRTLGELAQAITPRHTWDDLVLPADQLEQLREVHHHVQHRAVVHDRWGFSRKLATGSGLNVLFAGPPGTGKTMAAEVVAHELGLDLYRIDLSQVLNKYIGETEKNLGRLFDEARTSNAVLFFDEADALFGKRTQVRDAHDRYANVEVAYLLQRMDDYEGLVVLATNLRKNMDEAFVRRLHFTIEFPLPGIADRRRIWEQIWPGPTPLDPGLDLESLARDVPVSGGAIRNIALASAFLAAADGGVVTMEHLAHATRREYQKMGKVLTTTTGEPANGRHRGPEQEG